MPETAVYEDGDAVPWQNEVWTSRERLEVQSKAQSQTMQLPAN